MINNQPEVFRQQLNTTTIMANYENVQRVKMQFTPVLTRDVALNRNKTEYILEEFEDVLIDLMTLCVEKKNFKSLHRLVKIVRLTPWYSHQSAERVADVAETMYLGKGSTLIDETDLDVPKFLSIRIMRSFSAISQAIGFMANQWAIALPLMQTEKELRVTLRDLKIMRSYQYELCILQSDFKSSNGECQYTHQRWDAEEMVSDAINAVEDRLKPKEDEEE